MTDERAIAAARKIARAVVTEEAARMGEPYLTGTPDDQGAPLLPSETEVLICTEAYVVLTEFRAAVQAERDAEWREAWRAAYGDPEVFSDGFDPKTFVECCVVWMKGEAMREALHADDARRAAFAPSVHDADHARSAGRIRPRRQAPEGPRESGAGCGAMDHE